MVSHETLCTQLLMIIIIIAELLSDGAQYHVSCHLPFIHCLCKNMIILNIKCVCKSCHKLLTFKLLKQKHTIFSHKKYLVLTKCIQGELESEFSPDCYTL